MQCSTQQRTCRHLDEFQVPNSDEKYAHLKKLDKATENLKLFKADLLDYSSLCSATEGCRGVFLRIEPAVEGTLNVLTACAEAKGVIIVSCGSAVARNSNWDRVMDETRWSDKEPCRTAEVNSSGS
ncbi:hypothetical protein OIU76_006479 [Salix suchowensis]|nr:hypothetical protein OIU76_006479 [Salix suchowensis]